MIAVHVDLVIFMTSYCRPFHTNAPSFADKLRKSLGSYHFSFDILSQAMQLENVYKKSDFKILKSDDPHGVLNGSGGYCS